ncbi:CG33191, partial [Drosophila busckii]
TAQIIYRGNNFCATQSDEELFYDCASVDHDLPREGNSCAKSNLSCSDCSRLDDPAEIRAALERAACATQKLLKNFDRNRKQSCNATLEITARLITIDDQPTSQRCGHNKPVTVQMPLQFDPNSGQLQVSPMAQPPPLQSKGRTIATAYSHPQSTAPGDYWKRQPRCCAKRDSCLRFCPNRYESLFRDVVSIDSIRQMEQQERAPELPAPAPMPMPMPVPIFVPEPEAEPEPDNDSEPSVRIEQHAVQLADEISTSLDEPEEVATVETLAPADEPIATPPAVPDGKHYYLALPQHREFVNCAPCRFEPSPIMDEEGNVFCPGNCGCCQCAWKQRSFTPNRGRDIVKICRCVERGTIFNSVAERPNCSQTSLFDFCPCRERAEAKFLELYHCEMWSSPNVTRGREIMLHEIKEV